MGIRRKLLLTFIICFGLMAAISLPLLQRNMDESYATIERKDLTAHMGRMVQSVEVGLQSLRSQCSDWAVWTEMYDYASRPDAAWAVQNIGVNAMAPANLSLVMIYGAKGQLISMVTRNHQGEELALPRLLTSAYVKLLSAETQSRAPHCGLMKTDAGLMLTCWSRIQRSDSTGDFVGTVVMGRLLDQTLLAKLREQTQLAIELHDSTILPQGLQLWPAALSSASIGKRDFWSAHEPNVYHLYYPIQDLLQQDVALFTLDVTRDVHEQGVLLYRQVRRQLAWTALGTAILLGFLVHFLVIRRLRLFTSQLVSLAKESTWHSRINIKGTDELGILSSSVNTLLGLIEYQVTALKSLTLTDALTGLPNRREFDARLAAEFSRKQRHKQSLALLMLDVDYFKRYNDRYGHPAGDSALKELAKILTASVSRSADLAARIGGEEFAILLPDTDIAGAMAVADRARNMLHELGIPHADSSVASCLTISVGIAIAGDETIDAFIIRADQALYQAKNAGRDRAFCDLGKPV